MDHSYRAKQNMTTQLKAQLKFFKDDLQRERDALKKAESYLKYNLPGTKSMISKHKKGIKKTLADIEVMKVRIRRRQRNGECYKIL